MSRSFEPGDRVLLVDRKDRRYLVVLMQGSQFHTHNGIVSHDSIIGSPNGCHVTGTGSSRFVAVRPTLSETVFSMPRGAQVIYPKDLGAILMAGDIGVDTKVLESGVGSGALSMAMLNCGAKVTGYEIREDFAKTARANVTTQLGQDVQYEIEVRDVYVGISGKYDRVLLDLPEPWKVVEHAAGALECGGIFVSYLPSINQVSELHKSLTQFRSPSHRHFGMLTTFEVLHRTWHLEGTSVRPDHRMVAHTGFITTARLLEDSSKSSQVNLSANYVGPVQ